MGIFFILGGAFLLLAGCFLWLWERFEGVEFLTSERLANEDELSPRVLPVTVCDADGKPIVPDGVMTWGYDKGSYRVWDEVCNPGYLGEEEGYQWYLLDKAGTVVTDEELERIGCRGY